MKTKIFDFLYTMVLFAIFLYMYRRLILAAFFILVALTSCSRKVTVQPGIITETKDSVVYKEIPVYRDTVITIPGDSVYLLDTLFLPTLCPNLTQTPRPYQRAVKSAAGNTSLFLSIDAGGRLQVLCKADSLQLRLDSAVREIHRITEHYQKQSTTVTNVVPGPTVIKYRVPRVLWWLLVISLGLNAWHYRKGLLSIITRLIRK